MAVIPIYNCFHPVLRESTMDIKEFNQELKDFVDNMWDTLYNVKNGVGLAGNQVGADKSVIIIDIDRENETDFEPVTMINPRIISLSEEQDEYQEGCLSIPDYFENVIRPAKIRVSYYDIDMHEYVEDVDGFLARVMLHEIDHLNGKLFIDRLTPLRRTLGKSKLNKIMKGKIIPDYPMVQADGSLTGIDED